MSSGGSWVGRSLAPTPHLASAVIAAETLVRSGSDAQRARLLPAMARGRYSGRRLTVPTRLVVGRSDPVIRGPAVSGWEGHADDMEVEVIDGGHFLPEERPAEVLERALTLFS